MSQNRQRSAWIAIIGIAWVAGIGWLAANPIEAATIDVLPQPARDYSSIKSNFTPDQMIWAIPLIKQLACARAIRAIRYQFKPAPVSGPVCGVEDDTKIDDDLVMVTVSGTAKIGEIDRPFRVALEHYPSQVTLDSYSYIILSIDVGADDRRIVTESEAR